MLVLGCLNRHVSINDKSWLESIFGRSTLHFTFVFQFIFKRVWFIFLVQNRFSIHAVLLIKFSKLTRNNGRVCIVTQSLVAERIILFNSSTKQIERSLFSFLLTSGMDVFPVGSLNFCICHNLWASAEPEILGYVELVNSPLYCVVCALEWPSILIQIHCVILFSE